MRRNGPLQLRRVLPTDPYRTCRPCHARRHLRRGGTGRHHRNRLRRRSTHRALPPRRAPSRRNDKRRRRGSTHKVRSLRQDEAAFAEAPPARPSDTLDAPTRAWIFNDSAWIDTDIPCSVTALTRIRRGDPDSSIERVTYLKTSSATTCRARRDSGDRWAVSMHRLADASGHTHAETTPSFAADSGFRALSAAAGDGGLSIVLTDAAGRPVWRENPERNPAAVDSHRVGKRRMG